MLTVNEIFFSIQGEGTRAGRPCVLRLTGCPLRCVWCDTAYALHEGERRGEELVVDFADLRAMGGSSLTDAAIPVREGAPEPGTSVSRASPRPESPIPSPTSREASRPPDGDRAAAAA